MKTQLQYVWGMIAKRGLVDKETDTVSVIDIIERISVKQEENAEKKVEKFNFPFQIMTNWMRTVEKEISGTVTMSVDTPSGKNVVIQKFDFTEKNYKNQQRIRMNFNGLVIPNEGTGDYAVRIFFMDSKNKMISDTAVIPVFVEIR